MLRAHSAHSCSCHHRVRGLADRILLLLLMIPARFIGFQLEFCNSISNSNGVLCTASKDEAWHAVMVQQGAGPVG
eukprot:1157845-Pelagomonas_calceolata.AAC.10